MKKLIIALSTIFCTILIMVSIYTFLPGKPMTDAEEAQLQYIVRDYGGKVAVFDNSSNIPLVVYEIYTHLLPENISRFSISDAVEVFSAISTSGSPIFSDI